MFSNIQPFIPTLDFATSRQFYIDFGFEVAYEDHDLTLFKKDKISFFIQRYYVKAWAENTMLQLYVDNLEDIRIQIKALKVSYPMIKYTDIKDVHYGKTIHLIDPAGVLLHLTNPK